MTSRDLALSMQSVDAFVEELVVRRELSDNYCMFNQRWLCCIYYCIGYKSVKFADTMIWTVCTRSL
jgi:hypothetical protein